MGYAPPICAEKTCDGYLGCNNGLIFINTGQCNMSADKSDWICACQEGWTGNRCNIKTCKENNRCKPNGIKNISIGECISKDGEEWKCKCVGGYTGDVCQTKTCNGSTVCQNGGILLQY